ncbi:hypothetical protein INT45_011830 [Circinella minor]|uniref:Uncharacterized protein n=1 Tax=Circinella minor TaxID=1195481 RepID=A0A8H7SBD6_9FUNG|nr:hypothetical protein INT45_011830 [Circinella minor]
MIAKGLPCGLVMHQVRTATHVVLIVRVEDELAQEQNEAQRLKALVYVRIHIRSFVNRMLHKHFSSDLIAVANWAVVPHILLLAGVDLEKETEDQFVEQLDHQSLTDSLNFARKNPIVLQEAVELLMQVYQRKLQHLLCCYLSYKMFLCLRFVLDSFKQDYDNISYLEQPHRTSLDA